MPNDLFIRIHQLARAERFVPFTLVLSSGTRYAVPTRDHVFFTFNEDGSPFDGFFEVAAVKSVRTVSTDEVASVEVAQAVEDRT